MPLLLDRWHCLANTCEQSVRLVVLSADRPDRIALMESAKADIVLNPHAADGMASSIKAGLGAVPERCEAALFLPADMPEVTQDDLTLIRKAHASAPQNIIRAATPDGTPGNPVLFPRRFFNELTAISGDEGGRRVIKRHAGQVELVALPDDHASLDLDTPEDWDNWRARKSGSTK